MKSLILVWGNGDLLLGMFDTMKDAEDFVAASRETIKQRFYEVSFMRGFVGESYQDMCEFLYSFDPRDN